MRQGVRSIDVNDLDCHFPPVWDVVGAIDYSHAASSDFLIEPVSLIYQGTNTEVCPQIRSSLRVCLFFVQGLR